MHVAHTHHTTYYPLWRWLLAHQYVPNIHYCSLIARSIPEWSCKRPFCTLPPQPPSSSAHAPPPPISRSSPASPLTASYTQAEEDKAPLGQALLQLAHAADEVRRWILPWPRQAKHGCLGKFAPWQMSIPVEQHSLYIVVRKTTVCVILKKQLGEKRAGGLSRESWNRSISAPVFSHEFVLPSFASTNERLVNPSTPTPESSGCLLSRPITNHNHYHTGVGPGEEAGSAGVGALRGPRPWVRPDDHGPQDGLAQAQREENHLHDGGARPGGEASAPQQGVGAGRGPPGERAVGLSSKDVAARGPWPTSARFSRDRWTGFVSLFLSIFRGVFNFVSLLSAANSQPPLSFFLLQLFACVWLWLCSCRCHRVPYPLLFYKTKPSACIPALLSLPARFACRRAEGVVLWVVLLGTWEFLRRVVFSRLA